MKMPMSEYYNLDYKNPSKGGAIAHEGPKNILKNILQTEQKIAQLLKSLEI